MTQEDLEEELRAANANRAILYYLIFDELRKAHGEAEATKVMRAAIYRRGQEMAADIKQFAPDRIKALGEHHVAHSAGGGKLFNPEVKRLDDTGFEVLNTTCPLKEAWQAYGLSDAEVAKMCEIGSAIDYGKFEGAGFRFACDTWKPGKRGCCTLKAYPGK
ncbi:MAG TPA: L-2-amino-thiazoline-4-carboxylic acid hydrolase [Stellaceae bacterium]|nr:L-2-amino-thiazoline-4-carboxylic acid hydrolase [Stellaceae bacterium]